jgi:hypothetical protein
MVARASKLIAMATVSCGSSTYFDPTPDRPRRSAPNQRSEQMVQVSNSSTSTLTSTSYRQQISTLSLTHALPKASPPIVALDFNLSVDQPPESRCTEILKFIANMVPGTFKVRFDLHMPCFNHNLTHAIQEFVHVNQDLFTMLRPELDSIR